MDGKINILNEKCDFFSCKKL